MSSQSCWRCLSQRPNLNRVSLLASPMSQFSTCARLSAQQVKNKPKGNALSAPPRRGDKKTFTTKKKKKVQDKGKPPAIGERKALRKRVILSNTNAIEVSQVMDLTNETLIGSEASQKMAFIPGEMVDQLRAIGAFKATQSWGFFRRPAMLIRKEALDLAKELENTGRTSGQPKTVRRILVGERGSGKSTFLLQAMSMAFLKQWIVIHFPEGQDLVNGSCDYSPLARSSPTSYTQNDYIATLLSRLSAGNPALAEMKISQEHSLPVPLQSNQSLAELALAGYHDPEVAWPVFKALITELTTSGRPPLLITLDGLSHLMKTSTYHSANFKTIHAHDLAIVSWFMSYLSGSALLPNGGMILAAMSESNKPNVPTLQFRLQQLETKQALAKGLSGFKNALTDQTLPFLSATGQSATPYPQPDQFFHYDSRVFQILGSPFDISTGKEQEIDIQRMNGLSKDDARTLMEYWARSGMMTSQISERLIGEQWSMSGGGLIGELERGCVKSRVKWM